ncbi:MAG: 2-C-methyl-D-erythritol 4-phosphate cytidylyltransferase, partial [Planctomycetota bacterium]
MSESVAVIICAAGASRRFGGKRKKPFADVAGRAVFLRSVEFFSNRDDVKQILLAIAPEDEELVSVKWGPNLKFFNVTVSFGGAERFDTVAKT